jgi:hypothetical protein
VPNGATGPDGNGALHRDDDAAVDLGELVHDRPDGREVGVARVGRRRANGDVHDVGTRNGFRDVGGEAEPLAIPREQFLETGFVNRYAPLTERVDLRLDDVADDDLVTELSEARTGYEADVPRTEDGDPQR